MDSRKKFKAVSKIDRPEMDEIKKDADSFIDRILGDVSKTSATKQLLIGVSSGWLTGCLAMRMGKVAACAIGGGIILLEVAHQKGYIKINYDKINEQADKVSDQIQEAVTGQGPSWSDKMERFVDRKLDKAEGLLNKQKVKAKQRWCGSPMAPNQCKQLQLFFLSFAAGLAIGVAVCA